MVRRKLSAGKLVKVIARVHPRIDRGSIKSRNWLIDLVRLAAVRRRLRLLRDPRAPRPACNQGSRQQHSSPRILTCLTSLTSIRSTLRLPHFLLGLRFFLSSFPKSLP